MHELVRFPGLVLAIFPLLAVAGCRGEDGEGISARDLAIARLEVQVDVLKDAERIDLGITRIGKPITIRIDFTR